MFFLITKTGTVIPKTFRKRSNAFINTTKMHTFCKYIIDSSLNMPRDGILSSTLYALCIETKRHFVNLNKGTINPQNLPFG